MDLKQNTEEKGSSTNNIRSSNNIRSGKRRTLYIVNFTPIRLLVFSICSVILILFIFVLGFHLGGSKPAKISSNSSESMEVLMRGVENNLNTENIAADMPDKDIMALNQYEEENQNSSIIREGSSSSDRYNEYTKNLASELDAINANMKEIETRNQSPNTTYIPPQQLNTYHNKTAPVQTRETVTKVPYTRASSSDSIYFIQVAVGYDKDSTYSARDSLRSKFPKAFIKEEKTPDGNMMYKLKIGRYDTREEAQRALSEIKKIRVYKDSYIYSDKKIS